MQHYFCLGFGMKFQRMNQESFHDLTAVIFIRYKMSVLIGFY